ncbi:DUF6412 domain-containing protein [Amnibacterium kyonggiense]|uniref:Uncharacterized protein n=1 Tax=Amnibacterium kyonggiense TaxID=595671 RepID=A0A4R7FJ62_9MICO|nr:DUF6412 domain-containing protein [Amnibacterium kyonggiense]TDS75716.1 hypothetical protein CLV52_2823 [Amnibacterium kyonggiense]
MIVGLVGALVALARPEAVGAELLLAAGLMAVLAVVAVLRSISAPETGRALPAAHGFAVLRVLLRASDPSAEGHRRARAPGSTH